MVDAIKPRATQTKVKHLILENYIKAWGGIILQGLRSKALQFQKQRRSFDLHFVYVDCDASSGRYAGEQEDYLAGRTAPPVFGSPIVGVQALDSLVTSANKWGVRLRTNAILVEKEAKAFNELQRSLDMAGLSSRIRETKAFIGLQDKEIAIVHGDSTLLASDLVNFTQQGYKFSFYFLDPYGPTGIPLAFVREIVRHPRHDVIINFIYQDLHKKSGIVVKQDLTPAEKALIRNYNAVFGHSNWQSIVRRLVTEVDWEEEEFFSNPYSFSQDTARTTSTENLELELMESYRTALQSIDKDLTVKSLALRFPDKERTMFYLYLTTHDPTGALAINKILWDAGYQENELRQRLREVKQRDPEQLSFWDSDPIPTMKLPRPPIEGIAQRIIDSLQGKTVKRRDIYKALAEEIYFAAEIDRAIKHLKEKKLAFYEGELRNSTVIQIAPISQ